MANSLGIGWGQVAHDPSEGGGGPRGQVAHGQWGSTLSLQRE